jgi:N-hydroxyarylamine O-acetyltransferase
MTALPPATPEALAAYFERLGYAGTPSADLDTLTALHRLHVEAIPFENLDVLLGRPTGRDPRAAHAKLVGARRGGWCFESNGLFAWMLETIGFKVRRLAGAVMREQAGDVMIGNHLVLIVELDRLYVADVGLGNGLVEPVPLEEGPIRQGFKQMALERLDARWWRFRNSDGMMPPSFDFSLEVDDPALLDERCQWLQRDAESPFLKNAVLLCSRGGRFESLVGPLHTTYSAAGADTRTIADAAAYAATLRDRFGLSLGEAEQLWPKVGAAAQPGNPAGAA